MPIEIRELLIRGTVVPAEPDPVRNPPAIDVQDIEALKEEIVKECLEEIALRMRENAAR